MAKKHISDVKLEHESGKSSKNNNRTSLFRHVLNSEMPESELSLDRLSREAQVLLGAGSATTARTLDFISYYILSNDQIRSALQNDLKGIMSGYPENMPSWIQLAKLPYLHAVIKEGLR